MPYAVIGVRQDGKRRVLVNGLTRDHAETAAALIVETGIFREVIVQPEVTVERFQTETSPEASPIDRAFIEWDSLPRRS